MLFDPLLDMAAPVKLMVTLSDLMF